MPTLSSDVRVFILTLIYAALGIFLLFLGYRIFDWLTPRNLQEEVFKNGNVAVALVTGAFIVGLAIVILGAIHG
jgi:putative membrane protein